MMQRNNDVNFCISCEGCDKYFIPKRSGNGKYCSNRCQKTYEFNLRYNLWINGDGKAWSSRNPKSFKQALIKRDGYKCSTCKIQNWNEKPIVLELEHKDGNSDNNLPDNLCLICPNCHSQTNTYKAKNSGNGKHFRKERYKEGLSF